MAENAKYRKWCSQSGKRKGLSSHFESKGLLYAGSGQWGGRVSRKRLGWWWRGDAVIVPFGERSKAACGVRASVSPVKLAGHPGERRAPCIDAVATLIKLGGPSAFSVAELLGHESRGAPFSRVPPLGSTLKSAFLCTYGCTNSGSESL